MASSSKNTVVGQSEFLSSLDTRTRAHKKDRRAEGRKNMERTEPNKEFYTFCVLFSMSLHGWH